MTLNATKYVLSQIKGLSIVALIPAAFIGLLKFGSVFASGYPASDSLGWGLAFFMFAFASIVTIATVSAVRSIRKKLRKLGVSLDCLGGLEKSERQEFEKKFGILSRSH